MLGTSHFGFGWGGGGVLKGPTFTYAEIFKVTYAENYPHTFSTSLAPKNLWLPVNFHEIALPRNAKNDPQSKINLSLSCSSGVGWGGMITFMFLCTHRHSNLIIFLAVEKRQAQLFHDQLPVGWGELIRFMFLCLHTHSNLIIFLAVEHLHALLFHDQLPLGGVGVGGVGWGGVGWDDNVHVPMHTHTRTATSSSFFP